MEIHQRNKLPQKPITFRTHHSAVDSIFSSALSYKEQIWINQARRLLKIVPSQLTVAVCTERRRSVAAWE